ncbi:hypothetical protein AX16_008204 [Volvariella volvacea WC 439]|nr:hypothetical protein AX16_008204 [Volvariella volvacea WC 439]
MIVTPDGHLPGKGEVDWGGPPPQSTQEDALPAYSYIQQEDDEGQQYLRQRIPSAGVVVRLRFPRRSTSEPALVEGTPNMRSQRCLRLDLRKISGPGDPYASDPSTTSSSSSPVTLTHNDSEFTLVASPTFGVVCSDEHIATGVQSTMPECLGNPSKINSTVIPDTHLVHPELGVSYIPTHGIHPICDRPNFHDITPDPTSPASVDILRTESAVPGLDLEASPKHSPMSIMKDRLQRLKSSTISLAKRVPAPWSRANSRTTIRADSSLARARGKGRSDLTAAAPLAVNDTTTRDDDPARNLQSKDFPTAAHASASAPTATLGQRHSASRWTLEFERVSSSGRGATWVDDVSVEIIDGEDFFCLSATTSRDSDVDMNIKLHTSNEHISSTQKSVKISYPIGKKDCLLIELHSPLSC